MTIVKYSLLLYILLGLSRLNLSRRRVGSWGPIWQTMNSCCRKTVDILPIFESCVAVKWNKSHVVFQVYSQRSLKHELSQVGRAFKIVVRCCGQMPFLFEQNECIMSSIDIFNTPKCRQCMFAFCYHLSLKRVGPFIWTHLRSILQKMLRLSLKSL